MAISFDAANRARDLLMQVRSTLDDVGDPKIGFIAARWTDRARRAQLGEASRQVGDAAELLRTYGAPGGRFDKIGMAALDRLQSAIDEIRVGDARVAKRVGRELYTAYGDPFTRTARNLDSHLLQAELTALEMPGRPYWSRINDSTTSEQWLEFSDALQESAANVLRRSDDELQLVDYAALDRIAMRSSANGLLVGYPSDSLWGVHQLRGSHYTGNPADKLVDIRAWLAAEASLHLTGTIDNPHRALRVLDAAQQLIAKMPDDVAEPVAQLRDETVAMIERNSARIEGRRSDTYGRHPDYAEIGRIRENLPLLGLGSTKPVQVGERLTW